ncbi:hypothetical protein T439DRAFT_325372 [Meredithblackwellia eburnea MCA 4105]
MLAASSTRDLLRCRRVQSPVVEVAQSFLEVLQSELPSSVLLRQAFFPALLATDTRPRDAAAVEVADDRLRTLFKEGPASIILPQCLVSPHHVAQAWSETQSGKGGMLESVFVPWTLHQQISDARAAGDREEEANLSIMLLATLAYELSHWIFVKTHGYKDSTGVLDDRASIHTSDTRGSVSSLGSTAALFRKPNRQDVGDKAVLALFGCDFELLSYTIGEHQVVKRRAAARRSPTMTPPVIYSIIKDTPAIQDVTKEGPTTPRTVPTWKDAHDSMYSVVSIISPSGFVDYHGDCTLGEEFSVSFTGQKA